MSNFSFMSPWHSASSSSSSSSSTKKTAEQAEAEESSRRNASFLGKNFARSNATFMPSRPARKAKEVDVPPNAFLAKSIGGGSSSSSSSSRGRKETKATKQQKQKQQLDQQQQDEMQQQQAQAQQELQEQAAAQALYEQVSRVRDDARPRECACLTAWPTSCPLQSVA